ncbi:MAG: ABC transporter substrate-binding protein [Alcanivoracaceae bacterium]|jgi:phospholipid transport system substrate-binding protein|nr:ABC transporter substrate-binding protein [Alcanivoracaceae bacterium]
MLRLLTVLFAALLFTSAAQATASGQDPHAMLETAIDRMTQRIDQERDRLKEDEHYARKVVNEELEGLVDFRRITQLVMGNWFAPSSREQKLKFLEVFRASLVNTYASGLTLYEGQEVRVLPAQEGDVKAGRARVRTEIQTASGKIVPVFFSLYQGKEGNWLVENVIVNGLNLGSTFRTQFEQSAQQYGGDLDQVIANWSSEIEVETAEGPAEAAAAQ